MPVEIIKRYPDGTYKYKDKRSKEDLYGYEIQLDYRKKRRSGFPTREKAQEARAAIRLKPLLEEHGLVRVERVMLTALVAAWLDDARDRELSPIYIRRAEFITELFASQFHPHVHIDEITAQEIRKYKSARIAEGLHVHTLRQDLMILKAIFNSAGRLFPKARWQPPAITKPQRLYDSREVVLPPEEITELLDAIDREPDSKMLKEGNSLVRDYIIIALHTARRESEILSLAKSQVDFTIRKGPPFGQITFQLAKKGNEKSAAARRRVIPMTAPVAEIARRRIAESRNDLLFQRTSYIAVVAALTRAFRRICKRAKIAYGYENNGAVIHTLRHSAATYLSSLGLPLSDIKEILGHDSLAMSMKYAHSTPEEVGNAIRALSRFGVRSEVALEPDTPDIPDSALSIAVAKAQ
ncbi:MAG: site-specific integrase [Blastocatellia bacterium]